MSQVKFVRVPVEATKEMIEADPYGLGYGRLQAIWKAMIAAAPQEPQAEQQDKWHDAVLAECMKVESCYVENDPVKTLNNLIDWYVQAEKAEQPQAQDERSAFEDWAIKRYGPLKLDRADNGEYLAYSLHMSWRGWQARASLPAKGEQAEPEFNGWYCAHCKRGVDSSEVTFHEQHTVCGRVITDDVPPAPAQPQTLSEDLLAAVANLIKVKGRFHTEQAYQRVVNAYERAIKGEA